jgi:hypothetical protein
MLCFEVSLNGSKLCTAGVGGDGVLTAILSWAGSSRPEWSARKPDLHVGGLVGSVHVGWLSESSLELEVGDEVSIQVVESEDADEPLRRTDSSDPEVARRNRYFLYQQYKLEFEHEHGGGTPEELSPEEAKAIRRRLYMQYKREFENEPAAT